MKQWITITLVVLTYFSCTTVIPLQNEMDAKFIFRGTVEKLNEATLKEIADTRNCVVVKIKEVLETPPNFTDWTGRSITVLATDISKLKLGDDRVFFTNGWLYGESIAVIEVANSDPKEVTINTIQSRLKTRQDSLVRLRLRSTELVVSGKVLEIKPPEKTQQLSEHNPLWATAIINIETTEKGQATGRTVEVRFATSRDVMWNESPKFEISQRGIWLLRKSASDLQGYEVIDKADYFLIDQLEYIRSLIRG